MSCRVDYCDRDSHSRGLCSGHAMQSSRGKEFTPLQKSSLTADERYWAKVTKSDSCWNWIGGAARGYGRFFLAGRYIPAHWYLIPDKSKLLSGEMVVDHMCYNKSCVNPHHLQVVSRKQNNENQQGASKNSKSGVRGVYRDNLTGRWRVQVGHNYRNIHVGSFDNLEKAEEAAKVARSSVLSNNLGDLNGRSCI